MTGLQSVDTPVLALAGSGDHFIAQGYGCEAFCFGLWWEPIENFNSAAGDGVFARTTHMSA